MVWKADSPCAEALLCFHITQRGDMNEWKASSLAPKQGIHNMWPLRHLSQSQSHHVPMSTYDLWPFCFALIFKPQSIAKYSLKCSVNGSNACPPVVGIFQPVAEHYCNGIMEGSPPRPLSLCALLNHSMSLAFSQQGRLPFQEAIMHVVSNHLHHCPIGSHFEDGPKYNLLLFVYDLGKIMLMKGIWQKHLTP